MPKENSTHQVDPMDKWVSIEQAANYLGVSVVTVRSWLREKRGIPAVKIGKQWKFRLSDLENGSPAEAANSVLTKRKNKKMTGSQRSWSSFYSKVLSPFSIRRLPGQKREAPVPGKGPAESFHRRRSFPFC